VFDDEVGVKLSLKGRKQFSSEADRAAKDIDKISKSADRANRSSRNMSGGVKSLRPQLGGIAAGGAFVAKTVGGIGAVFGGAAAGIGLFGLKTASSLEQAQIGFTTMLGSAEKAQSFIAQMTDFAKKTPFEFTDVQTAASQLLAFGFASKDVLPTLTAVGDAAAGLGTGAEGVGRITKALGQIKAKGRIQSDELLQLYEAGIPALDLLAKKLGKTTKETQEMVTDGLVPADTAITALTEGMEQRFGGLMEKQSHTLGGIFSNLKDNVTLGLANAMKPVTEELKYLMPGAIRTTGVAMDWLGQTMGRLVAKEQQWRKDGTFTRLWERAKEVGSDLASVWRNSLWPAIQDLTSALGGKAGLLAPLGAALAILSWMADHPDAAKAIFDGAAIAITSWKLTSLILGVRNAMIGLNLAMAANPITLVIAAVAALTLGLGFLYTKLNDGRPIWETALAAVSPFAFVLLTVKNHLDGILTKLGLLKKEKDNYVKGTGNIGPWAGGLGSEGAGGGAVGAMARGGIVSSGGLSLVGERGPELLTLPRGSRVDPLPDGGLELGPSVIIQAGAIQVATSDPKRAAALVVEAIQDKLART
jgi:tape measure domain-containing protein